MLTGLPASCRKSACWSKGSCPAWAFRQCCSELDLGPRAPHAGLHSVASFLFLYFFKKKFTEIYFRFYILQFYTPTARQGGGSGPTARQGGGRDLYINKNKYFFRRGPWREPAAPCRAAGPCRPTSWRQGAYRPAGGRQAPSNEERCTKRWLPVYNQ